LVFHSLTRETGWDVKLLTYDPGGYATRALTSTAFDELEAQISPDSRLVAYCSNESGRMEVYVQEMAGVDRRWRVSDGGGTGPRWRGDGRELFFVNGKALLSAPVSAEGGSVSISPPNVLFENAGLVTAQSYPQYDVSADGSRILTVELLEEAPARCIRVVQNWLSEFQTPREQ
jgi:Tol biopolymer transport system component